MNLNTLHFDKLCSMNTSLAPYSTYEIGGTARHLAEPATTEEIIALLEGSQHKGLDVKWFGMGSNILFPDQPQDDTLFLSMKKHVELKFSQGKLFVSAGVPMTWLALIGVYTGIQGMEFTYLLPGTMGAGIYMNAKYFNHEISDLLDKVYYIDAQHPERGLQTIGVAECNYAYKQSIFQQNPWIIVGADLNIGAYTLPDQPAWESIMREMVTASNASSSLPEYFQYYRNWIPRLEQQGYQVPDMFGIVIEDRGGKRHFDHACCGSVFKNNYDFGQPTGKLVDQLGLRGTIHGQARISPYHGNFIQNTGGATASDILYLIQMVQDAINNRFGFVPEPEVVIL
ncbi:UDP-N-acetylmuramate dehydrogenase [Paenibacillus bovis]|uniref:UDP-N-acetylenolpyruvoylglucosamine reductase n=1 Tax=Paenibacillus bovis TaxID=1616788 RepID=A0A172ZGW1_9BACL|nr:FAD-binding protein [Paenibacillus bovis]ANF96876.1 UDP-N-acetylenolpyruvoylglucosamine reductase [Paenibacillus bovis]